LEKKMTKIYCQTKEDPSCIMRMASKVALHADIWTKKGMASSYLGVTAHFFTDERKQFPTTNRLIHHPTLAVRCIEGKHTGDKIRVFG
jgi:hypothetical protein